MWSYIQKGRRESKLKEQDNMKSYRKRPEMCDKLLKYPWTNLSNFSSFRLCLVFSFSVMIVWVCMSITGRVYCLWFFYDVSSGVKMKMLVFYVIFMLFAYDISIKDLKAS